ncbi:hypothetical protein [Streptomyces sp. NPDC050564]|uniref:hypothetical protein n=1 Tax=Streptomyces sp. NPDC050564 TaxID=3365631 RepID=UPI00378D323A
MSIRQTFWHDHELIFPMGIRKTRNLEQALATGQPLDDCCPVHDWPAPKAATEEWRSDGVLVVTFHPCGHRAYPQWDPGPRPSRYLNSPIAREPRRRRRRRA